MHKPCRRNDGDEKCVQNSVGESEGKNLLEKSSCKSEDNIEVDLREI
jgi:hypothetical protein